MTKSNLDKKTKTVMDVSKPGKSTPSASSRPIIVGHKAAIQDPMVNEVEDQSTAKIEGTDNKTPEIISPGTKKITPISEDLKGPQETGGEATTDKKDEESDPEAVQTDTKAETAEESDESAVVDAVVEQTDQKHKDAVKDQEDQKQAAEIEKLVDQKKYFLPIGERTRKKRRGRALLVLLLVLILAIGGYLAVDYFTDYNLPYEFFQAKTANQQSTNTSSDLPKNNAQTPVTEQKPKSRTYENKEFGFMFTVPEGIFMPDEPSTVENTLVKSASGKAYSIDFALKFGGGFVTKDWQPAAGQEVENVAGFTQYPACIDNKAAFSKILYQTADTCVVAFAYKAHAPDPTESGNYMIVKVRKKLVSSKTWGLEFATQENSLKELSVSGIEEQLSSKPAAEWYASVVEFAKSIKDINLSQQTQ